MRKDEPTADATGSSEPIIFKEILCNEHLIFDILARSKFFYEKNWNVYIELLPEQEIIKLNSKSKDSLERLSCSISCMIKSLIKINIEYNEEDFQIVSKTIAQFKEKYKEKKKIRVVYRQFSDEKLFKIGLTTYNERDYKELELLKKEINDWNFNVVGNNPACLLIFNYRPQLEGLIKMHLSTIFNVNESLLKFFTIEEVLVLEYDPNISKCKFFEKLT